MEFASRQDAGKRLGSYLQRQKVETDWVLGLPRGGVVVAAEVAEILQRPLDVLVVRKIGHPRCREFAVGALAEAGIVILDKSALSTKELLRSDLDKIIEEETARLVDCQRRFCRDAARNFAAKTVLIIDDGLATGATAEAAVLSARKQGANRIVVAVPVAAAASAKRLGNVADEVIALMLDEDFDAVACYYEVFPQTTDEEVLALLSVGFSPS